jgi:DNA-binding transcriptional LysR family regulator
MDPRHLVQLATILEKGSITRASRHLHLTQPTLTHNMQMLEMQAGGMLFERSRLGVRSTPLGELLAREGRDIMRRLVDAHAASARHKLGLRNQVRIGAGALVGAALMPGVTEQVLEHHPEIALMLRTDRPNLLVDQLVEGQHDLVIAPSWLDRPPQGIDRALLVADSLGVFCGPTHRLAQAGQVRPGAADSEYWVALGTASPFDKDVFQMLDEAGISSARAEITIQGDALGMLRILMKGRHLAVLPRYPVRLLEAHFPLVELAIQAEARPRSIHLWCPVPLLQDPTFISIRQMILDQAATASGRMPAAEGD